MFVLYGLALGWLAGRALGGETARIGRVRLRWVPAIGLAMVVQLLIFGPLAGWLAPGDPVGLAAFLGSSALAAVAAAVNIRLPGLPLMVLGAGLNLAAIAANGGVMPASREALAALGLSGDQGGFSNSTLIDAPSLPWLTDVFALPAWLPFTNVFSVGDILIALGCAWFVAASMLGRVRVSSPPRRLVRSGD